MSASEKLRNLSQEDLHELAKHVETFLNKNREELHKDVSEHLATLKGDVRIHEKKIPTYCKVFGLLILGAASALSYVLGRKSA